MKQLFVFIMVSLDGYHEGPNHDLDWHNVDAEFNDFAAAQLDEADTLIFGRHTYELMAGFWPTERARATDSVVAGKMNATPKLVVSNTIKSAGWAGTTVLGADFVAELRKRKAAPGKSLAILGSSNLCVSLLEAGLIDDVRLMYNPVLLGRGRPVFAGLTPAVKLELTATRSFKSGNVLHHYRPINSAT